MNYLPLSVIGDVDELFATLGWDKSVSGQTKAPFECGPWLIDRHFKSNEVYIYCKKREHMYVQK